MLLENYDEPPRNNFTFLWIFVLIVTVFGGYAMTDIVLLLLDLAPETNLIVRRYLYHTIVFIMTLLLSCFTGDSFTSNLALRKSKNQLYLIGIAGSILFSFSLAAHQPCTLTKRNYNIIEIVSMTILPAISEECIFRGWFLVNIYYDLGGILSTILTSAIFAFLHIGSNIVELMIIFAFSLFWCYIRLSSKTIFPSIICHVCHNFLTVLGYGTAPVLCGLWNGISFVCWMCGALLCFLYESKQENNNN